MILFPNALTFFLFFCVLFLKENVNCFNIEENISQLRDMIDNKNLYADLIELERLILNSLDLDEIKLPVLKPETSAYLDLSKFRTVNISETKEKSDYIIPTTSSNAEDVIKYEHITKEQLIESYNSENSNLIKKKNLIVRALRIVKLMLEPMKTFKTTKDFKKSLKQLNNIFFNVNEEVQEDSSPVLKQCFGNLLCYKRKRFMKKNIFPSRKPGDLNLDILSSEDLYFTTHANVNYMEKLDYLASSYNLGIFNLVGSHLLALGHFFVLKLALRKYSTYFKLGSVKFFSWKTILSFNISDRFKALDFMCNAGGNYEAGKKRRKIYLKSNRISEPEECNMLEILIHYFNKYQMELLSNAYQMNLKINVLLEHKDIKEQFFNFMCKNKSNCNIYDSYKFKSEYYNKSALKSESPNVSRINSYNIFLSFFYFTKHYNFFNHKNILYMHLLNLTGVLNKESKAYVSSIYLPGYFNFVELSFDEESKIKDLYENLLQCVETCHRRNPKYEILSYEIDSLLYHNKSYSPKCNMCEGTLFYINSKSQDNVSMLQKFYSYVTEVVKVNKISSLIKDMNIYEDYNNFLTNDINWYTFLLLFRLSTYKEIANKSVAEAMYLNLKKEDKFKRTVTTSYWFPSPFKKAYSLFVRKNKSKNLVEKLESLLSSDTINKIKKSIKFVVHVNSFLQLDFFYFLNEPPLKKERPYPVSMILEHKFKEWYNNSALGYFLLNYEDDDMRNKMENKLKEGDFVVPKYSKWVVILKNIIQKSYKLYFSQRNVRNLYKYHNINNINSKIMLMKDSYDTFLNNYNDIIFFADIYNLKKFLTITPRARRIKNKMIYFINAFSGNTVNIYKYGIIYGYTINKEYLKEIVDELYAIFKMNPDIFSDISFLQTVYLFFTKIEKSMNTHRRNDAMSMNNVFFFNVRKDYSKLSEEERKEEINRSMASKYFARTLFSIFQMMFSIKLGNYADKLDRQYGSESMLGLTVHEQPFYQFAYAYYGSFIDSVTNSFLPTYAKKPITQLKYGKTFIFSNLYKLCYHIYSMLNLNNLSLLCENQAIASANYYSNKKISQFVDRKFLPIITLFLSLRIKAVISESQGTQNPYINQFKWPSVAQPITFFGLHTAGNIYLRNNKYFSSGFTHQLCKQTEHSMPSQPTPKPLVHSISQRDVLSIFNSVFITIFIHHFMRWYAFYDNFVYFFINNIRVFDRFFRTVEYHAVSYIKSNFTKMTSDALLDSIERAYVTIRNKGYHQEAMEARLYSKRINGKAIIKNIEEKLSSLTPQDVEILLKEENFIYSDDHSLFEEPDENENFLNERNTICYREESKKKINLIPNITWAKTESEEDAKSKEQEPGKKKKKKGKHLTETEDENVDQVMMISRAADDEPRYADVDRPYIHCTNI